MSHIAAVILSPGVPFSEDCPQDIIALKLSNGSPFDLTINGFGFTGPGIIPAGTEYMLYAAAYNSGIISILPTNNVGASGNGVMNLTFYHTVDKIPSGSWPVTIPVQTVQAKVSTVTDLINDGNTAGHQFLESTVSGAPGSTWSFTNDGNSSFIGVLIANAVHKLVQIANSGNELKLGEAGNATEVLGQLLVDQIATFTGNIVANSSVLTNVLRDNAVGSIQATLAAAGITIINKLITSGGIQLGTAAGNVIQSGQGQPVIDCTSDTDTWINPAASGAGHVVHISSNSTERFFVDDAGAHIGAGKSFFFRLNSIGSISTFTGTGTGTYNHNNDGSPFFVVPIVTVSGSATQGYDTVTSTQVHITLGAALNFKAWTYR